MAKGIFYTVRCDDAILGDEVAFATKAEAEEFWRSEGCDPYRPVEKVVTADLPIRELLVAVFNREGYARANR